MRAQTKGGNVCMQCHGRVEFYSCLGVSTGQGLFLVRVYLGYLHAWPGKGVLLMLGASSDQGREYLHAWSREGGVITHVKRELWQRLILGYRLMEISACMAREGSFTHVRRVLRPRVGISACMVTGGWSFTHVRREHWPRVIFG